MKIKILHHCLFVLCLFSSATSLSAEIANVDKTIYLEALVSSDDSVRKNALEYLAREFFATQGGEFGSPDIEPRYQNYGDELLPYLYQSINNIDDPYAHNAVIALFYMSWISTINAQKINADTPREYIDFREKYEHVPNPSDYEPLKDALMLVLRESPDKVSRYWSAMVLGLGFGPSLDIEKLLFEQLLKERDYKVRKGMMEGIQHLSSRDDFAGTDSLSGFGLKSSIEFFDDGRKMALGSRNGMLLANQITIFEGHDWAFEFTIKPISDEKYMLNYEFYEKGESSGTALQDENVLGQVEGYFGSPLVFESEIASFRIESSVSVTRVPKCLKRRLTRCR